MRKLIVVVLGVLCALVLAGPAQAGDDKPTPTGSAVTPTNVSDCQSNEVCTFRYVNYGNPHYDYNSTTRGCRNIGAPWDNNIGSIVNNSPRQIWPFKGKNCWQGGSQVLDGLDAHMSWSPGMETNEWYHTISSIDFG